ncbi:MAG: tetratricopeptide repeat protein, partial [Cyanobacteria bacterium]|nr:tetratricopeptide repeat protein [Cyanobacteriota bacterium]
MSIPEKTLNDAIEQAMTLHQSGKLVEAQKEYERIIADGEEDPLVIHLLGIVHQQNGDFKKALVLFQQSLLKDPNNPTFHYNSGLLYLETLEKSKALSAFQAAVKLQSDYVEAWDQIAQVAVQLNQLGIAKMAYEELIKLEPALGQWEESLALILEEMNLPDQAMLHWIDAGIKDPKNAEACFRVAKRQYDMGLLEESVELFKHVLSIQSEHNQAVLYLAQALSGLGKAKEARSYFQLVYLRSLVPGIRLRRLLCLPIVYNSSQEVSFWRESFESDLEDLETQSLTIDNPVSEIGMAPFYLSYQGGDDKILLTQLANFLKKCIGAKTPSLNRDISKTGKLKIAVVSRHLHQSHTIERVFKNVIHQLDSSQFEIVECPIIGFGLSGDIKPIQPNNTVLPLYVSDFAGACDRLYSEEADIIFYTDIGMEPMSYYLGMQRLAPVQCVTWGHPSTTGISEIDYYLSSKWLETDLATAQTHYQEKLVLLDEILAGFDPVTISNANPPQKSQFGFQESDHLYVCPQTPYKFHPDFDALIQEVLLKDPQGKFVVFEGEQKYWTEQLKTRWKKLLKDTPEAFDRIVFQDKLPRTEFIRFLSVCDVMLDIPQFGGGSTSLDALSVGLPIVTLEGTLMKMRMTAGLLNRMGVTDTVVS